MSHLGCLVTFSMYIVREISILLREIEKTWKKFLDRISWVVKYNCQLIISLLTDPKWFKFKKKINEATLDIVNTKKPLLSLSLKTIYVRHNRNHSLNQHTLMICITIFFQHYSLYVLSAINWVSSSPLSKIDNDINSSIFIPKTFELKEKVTIKSAYYFA